tara:strand:+ start:5690 stop:6418 length:729 start_codon:yes stop_codon:yes gene_type:complete
MISFVNADGQYVGSISSLRKKHDVSHYLFSITIKQLVNNNWIRIEQAGRRKFKYYYIFKIGKNKPIKQEVNKNSIRREQELNILNTTTTTTTTTNNNTSETPSNLLTSASEIYKHYPKKSGKAKGIEKLQAQLKKYPDSYELILTAAKRYRHEVDDPKYYANFSTWVNQRRWEDYDSQADEKIDTERRDATPEDLRDEMARLGLTDSLEALEPILTPPNNEHNKTYTVPHQNVLENNVGGLE